VACRPVGGTIATSVVRLVIGAHWIVRTDCRSLECAAQYGGKSWRRPNATLVDPANKLVTASTLRGVQEAAPAIGLQIQLFVGGSAFFLDRRVQFATLTARDTIPATYSARDYVTAGGLMSYGTDVADMFRQVGVYTGP
jgi:hypothetical protein